MTRTGVSTTAEYTVRDQKRMEAAARYFLWQCGMALPQLGQRVLEIGCGVGNFTVHLASREMVLGIDIVDECIQLHHRNLGQYPHVSSRKMDIVSPDFLELKSHRFDSIVCLNVLEHISDDTQALRHMHEILPSGGRAVLIVPAFEALYGPIDASLGHYRRYSKRSLRQVGSNAGFETMESRYMNLPGFFGWWANARVFKRSEQSEAQIAFFDSKIVPWISALEDRLEPPFGQSIFTVLRKP